MYQIPLPTPSYSPLTSVFRVLGDEEGRLNLMRSIQLLSRTIPAGSGNFKCAPLGMESAMSPSESPTPTTVIAPRVPSVTSVDSVVPVQGIAAKLPTVGARIAALVGFSGS